MGPEWLCLAVSGFGKRCAEKLREGVGQPEAAIRGPVEQFLTTTGRAFGLAVVAHDEARVREVGARPDFAIRVDGVVTGHVELKKPGENLDPARFTGHNKRQWERLKDLPNLLFTNGADWRLYQHGALVARTVFDGDPRTSGTALECRDPALEPLLRAFLRWAPPPITTADQLVEAVAPLCRLLRESVLEQLAIEHQAVKAGADPDDQPFSLLARSWRTLLFPSATDEVFADGYAQTVTFALLLARTEGIDVAGLHAHQVAHRLGAHQTHSLMGQALKLLSESAVASFQVTLDLLRRVVGAVEWAPIWADRDDAYLHLYETFLSVYDPALRRASGSYYTPVEVVAAMVRLTEEVLTARLGAGEGYLSPGVTTIDPAMGTGTFLHSVIDHAARRAAETDGPGAVGPAVSSLAERLIGFELQMGPYTVAEMRAVDLLKSHGARVPPGGLRLHVTNTLDDPYEEAVALPGLTALSRSHKQANRIKAETPVTVVIGNPPYRERADGLGGWVESGSHTATAPLDMFREEGNGRLEYVLKNLYVYFWAWAAWKVFEAHPADQHGVICFITTSGYLAGPGFRGMRRYLRETCSEGWIINVSPEGMRPDVPTRVFPGVQQPLAIGVFVRRADTDPAVPADIRYAHVTGRREDKYAQLGTITLDGADWHRVRTAWEAPFLPAADSAWDDYPALGDLFCWTSPGIKPNRTWVYAPHPDILRARWDRLLSADQAEKSALFKETRDRTLSSKKDPLPDTAMSDGPLEKERGACPAPKRIAYRSFDRQWLIPDNRVVDFARMDLWSAEARSGQLYLTEQHSQSVRSGPAVVFSTLIPDMHYFKGSEGGRVLPLLHPDGSANLAPGLLSCLTGVLGTPVTASDVAAYIAGTTAHPAFTEEFADELVTPGVRVPITADPDLWEELVMVGSDLVWASTYGGAFADPRAGRPEGTIAFAASDPRRPKNLTPLGDGLPDRLAYTEGEDGEGTLHVGRGSFGPVTPRMWAYDVGGMNVIRKWFSYRKANPGGKKTSPLDGIHLDAWPREWITDLNELLTALRRVTDLESEQADLLDRVLSGPLITAGRLAAAGVRFPQAAKDRRPRYGLATPGTETGQGTIL
ncbi:type ISP restriction/modification enzyme [Actinorugispora endophytica]|uniref:site-specific DNA-methyltransferase (adenine-specific) n=1 Tax=Actinorugispora endophytica TaxID=1605990 RepID=A0A4R6V470_9ACTN|nr:type ISP restriction/modification enzyme [Actinorugispora endophytica]TDQ52999.1 N-6 DNA methylase [Actinorugispora endophytica]